ncbi:MAG: DUF115 domain-containing protein [Spirochaetaceae bacterium]|nr:DUF115 domain-containing protein [Spirochaetaceae bacterium]
MNENLPLSVDTGRGFSIYYQGKNLYSKYDPLKTPEKIAVNTTLLEETLYIIPSPLLLYGIDILLAKLPKSSYIIGIEIDQNLMRHSITINKQLSHDFFKIVRIDSREQIKMVIEDLGTWRFRRCELLPLNNGYNLYKDQYDYLYNFASFLFSTYWRNRLTINKLGKLWINNILINLQFTSVKGPENKGKPVVICGAGASLEESLTFLKSKREKLYIMAVDTALSPLLEFGIKPDIVFALESQFYNLGDFYNSKNLDIDLMTDITGYPQVCRNLKGKTYFFSSDFFENTLLERLYNNDKITLKIPPLGSVGVAAVYSALQLFKTNIFLTGLDFSFIPGKSHCKGSPFSNTMLRTTNRVKPPGSFNVAMNRHLLYRPGKLPATRIITDNVLESYAKLLIDIISQEKRVYDLTTTGYPLGATPVLLDEVDTLLKSDNTIPSKNISETSCPFDPVIFYEREKELLSHLISEWDHFNLSSLEEIPDSLMDALKNVDYIYIDFPDRLPHPIREISFISRAVKTARLYIQQINKLY